MGCCRRNLNALNRLARRCCHNSASNGVWFWRSARAWLRRLAGWLGMVIYPLSPGPSPTRGEGRKAPSPTPLPQGERGDNPLSPDSSLPGKGEIAPSLPTPLAGKGEIAPSPPAPLPQGERGQKLLPLYGGEAKPRGPVGEGVTIGQKTITGEGVTK